MPAENNRITMSLQRPSSALPRHTAMLISPWLLVGSALILSLAIAFWAVKNTRQERENMVRNLLERSGALIWAMEGSARAGMGMQRTAFYLQFMMEEMGRQPDIMYLAVITPQGDIVAHNNPAFIGKRLYSSEEMAKLEPAPGIQWRFLPSKNGGRMFEAYKLFIPLPCLPNMAPHDRKNPGHKPGQMGMMHGREQSAPPVIIRGPWGGGPRIWFLEQRPEGASGPRSMAPAPAAQGGGLTVVVGLDTASFESALVTGERNTLFTALLVGLLGLGGFLSLFWAQSYKMSRRMLLDTRAFADEVIGSLPLGLIILDASGTVAQVNAVAESMLGCEKARLLGQKAGELPGAYWADIKQRVQGGKAVLEEEHALSLACGQVEEGGAIPVSISASGIINEEGEVLGTLYLLRDLREVKRLQAELRRSERLSTLGNMAARVAHEIRNPLSSIKGFATYLGTRQGDEADVEAARTMIGEVDRLNRVVSELLDFARPSNLNIAPAALGEILDRTIRLACMDADAKGVSLHRAEADPESASVLLAQSASALLAVDAERITQALLNLVLNAVQATDRGGSVTLTALPPERGFSVLCITDTGKGMTPEILGQAFNPYFTTKATGTGLGLSIVAKIIEDHQGEIHMASTPGQGASVTIRLPLAPEGALPPQTPLAGA